MKYDFLATSMNNSIVTVMIMREAKLNALSRQVLEELKHLFTTLKSSDEVSGLILIGEGERAFVAGADIQEQGQMTPDEGEAFGALGQEVTTLMEQLPFPVVAAVNGFALGGGCELAMGADFIYATANAKFGQPEVNLGLIPGFGGCVRLQKYVGPGRAKELIYTARLIDAENARAMGLVNQIFESKKELLEEAQRTLELVASKSRRAVAISKRLINESQGLSTEAALDVEKTGFKEVFTIEDRKIGIEAFLKKETPQFTGR